MLLPLCPDGSLLPMTSRSSVTALLRLANATHGPTSVHELGEGTEPPDHDHLASADRLCAFLRAYSIPIPPRVPSVAQLHTLRVVRSATRHLAEGTASRWPSVAAPLLDRYHFRLTVDGRLLPTDTGWDGFIAERLRELVLLAADPRGLRLCQAETCRWLFLDDTRNQRRRWCDMATCGSRAKMRRYRARRGGSSASLPIPAPPRARGQALPGSKERRG